MRDYGMHDRAEAPEDSQAAHGGGREAGRASVRAPEPR